MKFSRNRAESVRGMASPNERRPDVRASDRQIKANERRVRMNSLTVYRPVPGSINEAPARIRVDASMPITGRYLAHAKLSRVERAFLASDLVSGDKQLIRPTIKAAMLAGVSPTYAWWAGQREASRYEIVNGWMPLVPPREMKSSVPLTDDDLFDIVKVAGLSRVLDACCAVEQAQ